MSFDMEKLNKLIEEICTIQDIKIEDIPCVDLYMDQVTGFFDDKLKEFKRDEDEKILTKTMINNYAKAKILLPVKNKKYTKENIILLTLIYNLKQVLSISDISILLKPLLDEIQDEQDNNEYLHKIYNEFIDVKKEKEIELKETFKKSLNKVKDDKNNLKDEKDERAKLLLAVFLLINGANIQKRMAEKIIDNFFKTEE